MKLYIVHASAGPWPVDRTEWIECFETLAEADTRAEALNLADDTGAAVYVLEPGARIEL
jgi:hypothetical protein